MSTSQDFKKRIDITALTEVTGSEINQLLETALPADDKGLRIITTDTAADVPDVPNPSVELEGITPTHWKRYKWVRQPFTSGAIKEYNWNETLTSDATYLKWEQFADLEQIQEDVADALDDAAEALATANTASTNATTAVNTANAAQEDADAAQETADEALGKANQALTGVTTLQAAIDDLDSDGTDVTFPISIGQGGTGAITAARAHTNLYLDRTPIATWILKETAVQGVNGGAFTAGAWRDRIFNTAIAEYAIPAAPGLSVGLDTATGIFSLSAGLWLIEVQAGAASTNGHQAKLYNNTTGTDVAFGTSEYSNDDYPSVTHSKIVTIVTLADTTNFKVQHKCSADGLFGIACNFGTEVYAIVKISKLGMS
jgi:hypothetical protein